MSNLIRIAAGNITANDLLTTSSHLVSNWTRQTDMSAAVQWRSSQPEFGVTQEFAAGLEVGSGKFYGKMSGVIEFFYLTEDMRQYIHNTIMASSPIAPITAYLHHPLDGFQAYQGELVTPFAANAETNYSRFDDSIYNNNQYLFRRGTQVSLKAWGTTDGSAWSWLDGSAIGKVTQT